MLLHKSVVHDSRVRREASALAEAGYDVAVLELDPDARGELDAFRRVSVAPPAWLRRVAPRSVYRAAFVLGFVVAIVRSRPDVVHAHDAAMLLPGIVGARLTRAQLVYDTHELATGVPYRERAWALFIAGLESALLRRCAHVVTVTDEIAERLEARYRLRKAPVVVRNVTDLEAPPAPSGRLRQRLGLGADEPLVLHQGAPAPDRGCEQLIEAMTSLPAAHLVFLGSSPFSGYEDGLRRHAVALGVSDRTHFLPSVPLEELLSWTADADVGVSLLQDTCENHRLALPNKLFEYLAAGVPVVTSDFPAMRRVVADYGVGWVTQPARADAIAAALERALEQRENDALHARIGEAARELNWRNERTRLLDMYDGLFKQRSRRALIFVRNPATHDARVAREAATLEAEGLEPVVVAVVSATVRDRRGRLGIAPVLRLNPRSPFRGLRDRVKSSPDRVKSPDAGGSAQTKASGAARTARPCPRSRLAHRVHRTLTAADWYRQGIGAVRALRPVLVHCNDWNTMWIGAVARIFWRIPVVYDSHELWADRNGRPEWRGWVIAAEALFVRIADRVVTTSPGYAAELARRYRIERPAVVRNVPAAAPQPDTATETRPELTYVGGLMPGRGLEQVIAALPHVDDVRLVLIGPGHERYRRELLGLAGRLGVTDRVEVRDPVAATNVVAAVRGSAAGICLIQPVCKSYELTLPNKLFEYAAAGVPTLASDLPVIASHVRAWGIGEVAPPDDTPAIVEAIKRLLEPSRNRELRDAAHVHAREVSWQTERERLAAMYRAVLTR